MAEDGGGGRSEVRRGIKLTEQRVIHRKRTVVEPDGHDTIRSIKNVTGIATTV